MKWFLRFVGLWTIADAIFLLVAPKRWSRWWVHWLGFIGASAWWSRLVGLMELGSGVYLIQRSLVSEAKRETQAPSGVRANRAAVGFGISGPLNAFFRAPIPLYRRGFGWLFGHRFLMLTHRGRKSGRIYETVLEVVHYDPRTKESVVVSGWGTGSDWYRNIRANPPISVQTGHEKYQPTYRELAEDETYPIMAEYLRRAPPVYRGIVERTLFGGDATEEEKRVKTRTFVMIAFRPNSERATTADSDT